MLPPELEVIKDIPCYRLILQTVIKYQIQQLLLQLSEHTKEESVILSASSDGAVTYQGTSLGETFLEEHEDVKSMFLNFCTKNHTEKTQSDCETSSTECTTVQANHMATSDSLPSAEEQQEPEALQANKYVLPQITGKRRQPSVIQTFNSSTNVLANSSLTTLTGIPFQNSQASLGSLSDLLPTSTSFTSQQSVNVSQNSQTVATQNVIKSGSEAKRYFLVSNKSSPQIPGSRTVNIVSVLDGNKKSNLAEKRYQPYPQTKRQCPPAVQQIPIIYLQPDPNKTRKSKKPVLSDTQSLSNIKIVSVRSCASGVASETPNSDSFSPSSSNQCDNLFENADTQDRKDNITLLNTVASLGSAKENSRCSEENETSMNSLVVTKHEDTMDCENVTVIEASSEVQVKVEEDSTCPSGILNSASSVLNSCNQSVNSFEDPHTEDKNPSVHEDSVNDFVVTRCDDSDDDNMDCENDKLDDTGNAVDTLDGEGGSTSKSADGATTEAALEKEEMDDSSGLRDPDSLSFGKTTEQPTKRLCTTKKCDEPESYEDTDNEVEHEPGDEGNDDPKPDDDSCEQSVSESGDDGGDETKPDNDRCDVESELDEKIVSLDESEMIKDLLVPSVFVRKIQTSKLGKKGNLKKTDRVQNSYHACYYCQKMVQHIPIHLKMIHKCESEVKEIIDLQNADEDSEKKLALLKQNILRAKGDNIHNMNVVKKQKGELLLFRRPSSGFDHKDFGPCPICMDWILLTSIAKHQKTCSVILYEKEMGNRVPFTRKKELLPQTDKLLGKVTIKPSNMMLNEVYKSMARDKITEMAQKDQLFLGESWLEMSQDNKVERKYFTSQHMRLCASLLVELQKLDGTEKSVWDYLKPSHFDCLVEASLNTALPEMDDIEDLKSPSNAIQIKYDILRLIAIKIAFSVREGADSIDKKSWAQTKKEAEECKFLLEAEWSEKVIKLATTILRERKMGKNTKLPKPEDIETLGRYLNEQINLIDLVTENATWERFRRASQLVQSKLIIYNQRRSGELECIQLCNYMKDKTVSDIDGALMGELSELNKYLLDSHKLIEIRGKCGRFVPVLIPSGVASAMDFLASAVVRKKVGILEDNTFLFANRGSDGVQRVYEALQTTSNEAGVESPEQITSVNMRKYTATLAQVLDLTENQLQWMCCHLGHTKAIHLQNYRQASPFIERVHIAKTLLMQDLDIQNKFIGKKLEDIDFMDILKEKSDNPSSNTTFEEQPGSPCVEEQPCFEEQTTQIFEEHPSQSSASPEQPSAVSKMSVKMTFKNRQQWTAKEIQEIKLYLRRNLDLLKTPGQKEVLRAIDLSKRDNGELQFRNWHTIVKKVSALILKIKRKT